MIDAAYVVERIGKGVQTALKTNQLLLGVEQFEFENATIRPEYVTTVKVAEQLTDPGLVVSLETRMKMLRHQAARLVRLRNCGSKPEWERARKLVKRLDKYRFGESDGQILDMLVLRADPVAPPALVAEVKLGAGNRARIIKDIDRIICLLCMYEEAEVLDQHRMYGAVVFHSMREDQNGKRLRTDASKLLGAIRDHLKDMSSSCPWLNYKADLLSSYGTSEPVYGYRAFYDDGSYEDVFGKQGFAFAPGLVLLGKAGDIASTPF